MVLLLSKEVPRNKKMTFYIFFWKGIQPNLSTEKSRRGVFYSLKAEGSRSSLKSYQVYILLSTRVPRPTC